MQHPNHRIILSAIVLASILSQAAAQPQQPMIASRGKTWPGAKIEPCAGAQIVARVGSEVILYGDVIPGINEIRQANKGKISDEQLDAQIKNLLKQRLPQHVETKLVYYDAKRTIPEENFPRIEESLGKQFEKVEIKRLMERSESGSRRELEEKLRKMGSSIKRQKRAFMQRILAQQWIRQQAKFDEEITYDRTMAYYREHREEFEKPARARWEQLTVRYSEHPTNTAAHAEIARLGNQILEGVSFAEAARRYSDGPTAEDGGRRDWTTKGNLVCEELDRALFGLPLGKLSPIIRDKDGFHIVRVTEREQAGCTPFTEAQVDIREKIRKQRTQAELEAYVQRLKDKIPVWTIFDAQ